MKTKLSSFVHSRPFMVHFLPTILVLFALLWATVLSSLSASRTVQQERDQALKDLSTSINQTLARQFSIYDTTLQAAVGFMNSSDEVTASDWQNYFNNIAIAERSPGFSLMGYADSVVRFAEPLTDRSQQVIGVRLSERPNRQAALDQARDTGELAATNKVTLLSDELAGDTNEPAFILYAPRYKDDARTSTVEQRREAILGYTFLSFRAAPFFDSIFKNENESDLVGFTIFSESVNPDNVLYTSKNYGRLTDLPSSISYTSNVEINGTSWIFHYRVSPQIVPDFIRNRPIVILISGIVASAMIAGLVLALLVGRSRSLLLLKNQEVESAKDELLSMASHQLRTPATGVKQYLGLVLEGYAGKLDDDKKVYLQKAYDSNERQLHIINELLYVAKATSGRIVLTKQHVNINELITDTVSEQAGSANEKKISLNSYLLPASQYVFADKHTLHMALENLISNAIKYTPRDGKVDIRARKIDHEIRISVKDNGVGIHEQDTNVIFEQFSRVPNPLSQSTSGSGIGLYLARHLVELHGGRLTVKSQIDRGSVFTIHLPIEPNDNPNTNTL